MTDNSKNSELDISTIGSEGNPDIQDTLESLPKTQREEVIKFIEMTQNYQGPIMPPQLMKQLEEIIPGGAERALRLSEKEQDHRHFIVKRKIITESWQIKVSLVGGVAAFVLLVFGILFCAINNYTSGVIALGGIGAFGVVSHIIKLPTKEQKSGTLKKP